MAKKAGSLPRGRRTPDEVPPVPNANDLDPLDARAQRALLALVDQAGGRFASTTAIPVGHVAVLTDLLDAWGRRHAISQDGHLYFGGQPGLWHALDQLYPLQDPNRWDQLRKAIVIELERTRSWRRREPPRGIAFDIGA